MIFMATFSVDKYGKHAQPKFYSLLGLPSTLYLLCEPEMVVVTEIKKLQ